MKSSPIPWRRVLAEGAVIVASILLALSAEAWWGGRQDRSRELDLLRGIHTDFGRTRDLLVGRIALLNTLVEDGATLRDLVAAPAGTPGVQIPADVVCSATVAPSLAVLPVLNTLEAALASGEIALLTNPEIRETLAGWQTRFSYVSLAQERARLITEDQVVPLLSQEVPLGPYFTRGTTADCGTDVPATVRPSFELSGALALRYNYHVRLQGGLPNLLERIDELLVLLEDKLAD